MARRRVRGAAIARSRHDFDPKLSVENVLDR
jgi:hypothetical protein